MSHSERLSLREIRNVFHLLEEIGELGLQPMEWRRHMLTGLCKLTSARVGITMDLKGALPGNAPQSIASIDVGFADQRERGFFVEYLRSVDWKLEDPSNDAIFGLHQRRQFFTRTRQELVDSPTWYAAPVVSEARRASDVDHFLVSSVRLGQPGWSSGFILYRSWGETPFSARNCKLTRLFHTELLRRLWPTATQGSSILQSLPRHQRLVLRGLLCGEQSKEIARDLDLSTNTVNSYTRELYRRLGVNSRGELMRHLYGTGSRPVFLPRDFEM